MNLTLHHFRKEARYLMPRWWLLLCALTFNFVIQMDWVMPMTLDDGDAISFTRAYLGWFSNSIQWLVVAWFGMSTAPEDDAPNGQAFGLTRPISRWHYWGGRLAVWGVLAMLPLMAQAGLYLLLNGCTGSQIIDGVMHRGGVAASMTPGVFAMSLLLRGWQRFALVILAPILCDFGLNDLTRWILKRCHLDLEVGRSFWDATSMIAAAWAAGGLLCLLALLHLQRQLNMRWRVIGVFGVAIVWNILATSKWLAWDHRKALPSDLAERASLSPKIQIPVSSIKATIETPAEKPPFLNLRSLQTLSAMPSNTLAMWRATSTRVTQGGVELPELRRHRELNPQLSDLSSLTFFYPMARMRGEASGFLTMQASPVNLGVGIAIPSDKKSPLDIELDLNADWMRLRILGELPVKPGARFRCDELEFVIDRLEGDQGDLIIDFKKSFPATGRSAAERLNSNHVYLQAPGKRLLWQLAVSKSYCPFRGEGMGWVRFMDRIKFQSVLVPGSGVTMKNLEEQRLVFVAPEYLGSSQHQATITDLRVTEKVKEEDNGWPSTEPLTRGNPNDAFLNHVRLLPKPPKGASPAEIARYVASVYAAEVVFEHRHDLNDAGNPKWPGNNDQRVAEELAPYITKAPEVLRGTLKEDSLNPRWFTDTVITVALAKAGIRGIKLADGKTGAQYQSSRQSPDDPNIWHGKTLPLTQHWLGRGPLVEAAIQCLRTHSDNALWNTELKPSETDDEIMRRFAVSPNAMSVRYFARTSGGARLDEARRLAMTSFDHLPRMTQWQREHIDPIGAATTLGSIDGLDWLLRMVGLHSDTEIPLHELELLQNLHGAVFESSEQPPDRKAIAQFIREARGWTPKDFRYDAAHLRWELLTPH